jgi:hypothetical protein
MLYVQNWLYRPDDPMSCFGLTDKSSKAYPVSRGDVFSDFMTYALQMVRRPYQGFPQAFLGAR